MSWFRKRSEQKKWSKRVASKRQELSASVEESLADPAMQEEQWLDEDEEEDVAQINETSVIPPRLSLQSKPLPAIYARARGIVEGTTAAAAKRQHEPEVSEARMLSAAKTAQPPQTSQRLSLRTTKVHLQVVPKPQAPVATHQAPMAEVSGTTTGFDLSAIKTAADDPELSRQEARESITGKGVFESGQSEVGVTDTHVTANSVVVVMLAGDPGPVVVQYVSLTPHYGFTVHLSAPTANITPFNYAILG